MPTIRRKLPLRLVLPALFLMLLVAAGLAVQPQAGAQDADQPDSVVLVGFFQDELGCDEDWQPDCDATALAFDDEDGVWQAEFTLPAGEYTYRVALNGTLTENYGAGATPGGTGIPLSLAEETRVTFIYDHATYWVTDNVNSRIATAVGDFQDELGCARDWMPDCLQSWMQDPDADGVYDYTTVVIPGGEWKYKVALDQGIRENYGMDGELNGQYLVFEVPDVGYEVTFTFESETNLIAVSVSEEQVVSPDEIAAMQQAAAEPSLPDDLQALAPEPAITEPPDTVTIAGSLQDELGCDEDWQPACEATMLTYDAGDDLWKATWTLPAGSYEYKAALNADWEPVNYGLGAEGHGPNIPLELEEETEVTFFYNHRTHWVSDTVNSIIANVPGSFQSELGCPPEMHTGDWEPPCLRTLLEDPDGDGVYVFFTNAIPPGSYELKVAINQSWDENYGLDGAPGGANIPFTIPAEGHQLVVAYNTADNMVQADVSDEPTARPIYEPPKVGTAGNINAAMAHWVAADTIAWDIDVEEGMSFTLHYSPSAELVLEESGVTGGASIPLTYDADGLGEAVMTKFPHLANLNAFTIDEADLDKVPEILKGQFAVSAVDADGEPVDATALQIPGVLDDLYTYDGDLGVIYDGDTPALKVWAPTAQNVRLLLYDDADPVTEPAAYDMDLDPDSGVWSITGEPDWTYKYYLYEVTVFAPASKQIETNLVTDPYSISLAMNSTRSQIVDLYNDPALKPEGWDDLAKPPLAVPEDIALYELHVRDFSVNDPRVPEEYKGTYLAFALQDTNGMAHLRALAEAGLTHIHLLPTFDIATINENKAEWVLPDWDELASYPPDSDQQQATIEPIRDQDAFNWGYDPYHYTVPEGSYATDPNGAQRILEFRQMVMGLNEAGLRVVLDVVYNHTNASGQTEKSVLDKVVPGYYHRLNEVGGVTTSTCCQNTATEHNMMEKLMVDSVVMWAKAYKVDGYRFDLMGHHMVDNMAAVRAALDALTLDADGVDGPAIYVYGEGWDFGEVQGGARGPNATQLNIGGLGIGSFNDRIRDAVRGGNPFGDRRLQGFITGLYHAPSAFTSADPDAQKDDLLHFADTIRVGLAGNLRDYEFVDKDGDRVTGADIDYNGAPAGYTLDPQEHISYISAHDNETLFDKIQFAAPLDTPMDERVRMQNMGLSIVSLSQGVPFFHAGSDMLRSKSMDGNSYNSGDWFNKLDFTYQDNNWGVGLPPASDNAERWDIMRPRLADPALKPEPEHIMQTVQHAREMLAIRKSSRLFRLETASDIQERVMFHNTGPDQVPGLIVMSISDLTDVDLDPRRDFIVVLFNATPDAITYTVGEVSGMPLQLHPVLADSYDSVVQTASFDADSGSFTVPAQTTAVFVLAGEPVPPIEQQYNALLAANQAAMAAWRGAAGGDPLPCGEYPDVISPDDITVDDAALEPLRALLQDAAGDTGAAVALWQAQCDAPDQGLTPQTINRALFAVYDAQNKLGLAADMLPQ